MVERPVRRGFFSRLIGLFGIGSSKKNGFKQGYTPEGYRLEYQQACSDLFDFLVRLSSSDRTMIVEACYSFSLAVVRAKEAAQGLNLDVSLFPDLYDVGQELARLAPHVIHAERDTASYLQLIEGQRQKAANLLPFLPSLERVSFGPGSSGRSVLGVRS